jgi:hypothetical protein
MVAKQDAYKDDERVTTVLGMVEEAQTEIEALHQECIRAAQGFHPTDEHPKALAFRKAAQDLEHIVLDQAVVMPEAMHRVVTYPIRRPRRVKHQIARWCRARNLASGLRRASVSFSGLGLPGQQLVDMLVQAAYELEAITFPVLYDPQPKGDADAAT